MCSYSFQSWSFVTTVTTTRQCSQAKKLFFASLRYMCFFTQRWNQGINIYNFVLHVIKDLAHCRVAIVLMLKHCRVPSSGWPVLTMLFCWSGVVSVGCIFISTIILTLETMPYFQAGRKCLLNPVHVLYSKYVLRGNGNCRHFSSRVQYTVKRARLAHQ